MPSIAVNTLSKFVGFALAYHRNASVHNEQPPPASNSHGPIHVGEHACSDEATKHISPDIVSEVVMR